MLNSSKEDQNTVYSIYYQNMRGIKTKLNDLKIALLVSDYDFVIVTESWLNSSVYSSEFCVNYNIFRKDRNSELTGKSQGGGVFLATGKKFSVTEIDLFNDNIEGVCVKVNLEKTCVYIVGVYVPPGNNSSTLRNIYECIEEKLTGKFCIIVGDFNIHEYYDSLINNALLTDKVSELNHFLAFNDFYQKSYVVNDSSSILDLVISNLSAVMVERDICSFVEEDKKYHPSLSITFLGNEAVKQCTYFDCENYNLKKADFLCTLYETE